VSLPTADDLFRSTRQRERGAAAREMAARPRDHSETSPVTAQAAPAPAEPAQEAPPKRSSGRIRHDEKMTVYVTADELLDIEHARLSLRRDQGLAVDRGRLVREAIAIVLADLEVNGDDSVLVQRLIGP
jgi:hypothetical protein